MPPVLPPGSRLRGRYTIQRTLHQSRLQNLYIAEDQHIRGKFWVVKELQPIGVDPGERQRILALFQAEALQLSSLEHLNLPKLVDFFSQETLLYLIREFIPGTDLEALLKSRPSFPEAEALRIGVQLADLLAYLDSRKLPPGTLRDMRLNNLLLSSGGDLKLLDLGFGRLFAGSQESMGSPDYSAPEQFQGVGQTDARTLVYNVGALLYHLLSGRNPGASAFNLTPLAQVRPGVSSAVAALVERATDPQPRQRPSSLQELKRGLERALSRPGRPTRPTLPSPTQAVPSSPVAVSPDRPLRAARPLPLHSLSGTQIYIPPSRAGASALRTWLLGALLTLALGGALVGLYVVYLRP